MLNCCLQFYQKLFINNIFKILIEFLTIKILLILLLCNELFHNIIHKKYSGIRLPQTPSPPLLGANPYYINVYAKFSSIS